MKRSELCNDFLRQKLCFPKYLQKTTQLMRNLFAKSKKQYFSNLWPKRITDNKNLEIS